MEKDKPAPKEDLMLLDREALRDAASPIEMDQRLIYADLFGAILRGKPLDTLGAGAALRYAHSPRSAFLYVGLLEHASTTRYRAQRCERRRSKRDGGGGCAPAQTSRA